jgi:hypothetical protein
LAVYGSRKEDGIKVKSCLPLYPLAQQGLLGALRAERVSEEHSTDQSMSVPLSHLS